MSRAALADLIETLWNVKSRYYMHVLALLHDLIETLWNVKPEGSRFIIWC